VRGSVQSYQSGWWAQNTMKIAPFPILLIVPLVIWVVFELSLALRDLFTGRGRFGRDRGSKYVVSVGLYAGLFLGAGLRRLGCSFAGNYSLGLWIGVATMLVGLGIRIWAVVALGGSFRLTVETHKDQKLVDSGPYRYVRHPAYCGLLLICLGYGLSLQNWLSLASAIIFPVAALLYRIHVEEQHLISSIGEDYNRYQMKTKRLIPWIW
jgi:protein-S-isoprenylcysteine O-methyltransferase Ste14